MTDNLQLFALASSDPLGKAVAGALGLALGRHEERSFEDGEHKVRLLESVRGRDVFVINSLYGEPGRSPGEKLCRLLFFIAALKDAGAARDTAVVPYLAYSRKDRRTQPFACSSRSTARSAGRRRQFPRTTSRSDLYRR